MSADFRRGTAAFTKDQVVEEAKESTIDGNSLEPVAEISLEFKHSRIKSSS